MIGKYFKISEIDAYYLNEIENKSSQHSTNKKQFKTTKNFLPLPI